MKVLAFTSTDGELFVRNLEGGNFLSLSKTDPLTYLDCPVNADGTPDLNNITEIDIDSLSDEERLVLLGQVRLWHRVVSTLI